MVVAALVVDSSVEVGVAVEVVTEGLVVLLMVDVSVLDVV